MPSVEEHLESVFQSKAWADAKKSALCPEDLFDFQSKEVSAEDKRQMNNHLNHLRQNCISFIPIRSDEKVLEIGSDCGTLTSYLAEHAAHVVCIEENAAHTRINKIRNQKHTNITYFTGTILDYLGGLQDEKNKDTQEKFDKIYMIGSFPSAAEYMPGEHPYEDLLVKLKEHLTAYGQLILAMPNQLGLKYFAGSREDYTRGYFISMEGFKDYKTRTFRKKELLKMGSMAGFLETKFYYPFPDYRFPTAVYTDERQPGTGELANHFEGVSMEHMTLFDETLAFDQIVEEGLFPELSNSFIVVLKKGAKDTAERIDAGSREKMIYTKFSNDRTPEFNIRTIMTEETADNGDSTSKVRHLYKMADTKAAQQQIRRMETAYQQLLEIYDKTKLEPNKIKTKEDKIEFEFIQGISIEESLDQLIAHGEYQQARELFMEMIGNICSGTKKIKFHMTDDFLAVFKHAADGAQARQLLNEKDCFTAVDIDMIPANIFKNIKTIEGKLQGERWTVIDYEWTFFFPIPVNYIIYRAIHYYADTNEERSKIDAEQLYHAVGISGEERRLYECMEQDFQNYVVGEHTPLSVRSKSMIDMPTHHISHMVRHVEQHVQRQQAVLYYDMGEGFTQEHCIRIQNQDIEEDLTITFPIQKGAKALRLNIWNYDSCLVEIKKMEFDKPGKIEYLTSAYGVSENVVYFDHGSPAFYITELPPDVRELHIDFHIIETNEGVKQALVPRILWKRGIKQAFRKLLKK